MRGNLIERVCNQNKTKGGDIVQTEDLVQSYEANHPSTQSGILSWDQGSLHGDRVIQVLDVYNPSCPVEKKRSSSRYSVLSHGVYPAAQGDSGGVPGRWDRAGLAVLNVKEQNSRNRSRGELCSLFVGLHSAALE